jgi:hypothetical protein
MVSDLGTAALDYGGRGWHVIPLHNPTGSGCTCGRANCDSPAKHPRTAHGLKDATDELGQIVAWWTRWPEANIGLRTGIAFDVMDIDGDEGMTSINRAAPWFGEPWDGSPTDNPTIDGPVAITGRDGGYHVYLAVTGLGNKAGLIPHIDWRGRDGYVVAPPSLHPSGKRYSWFPGWSPDEQEIRPAPAWLLALLAKPVFEPSPMARLDGPRHHTAGGYGLAALQAEVGRVALAPVGERNATLNRAAFAIGQLIGGGEIEDPTGAVQALLDIGHAVGLGDIETFNTVDSGIKSGSRQPRRAPRTVAS